MKEYIITAFDFQETIDLDPFRAEDVPELIRCKDCIYGEKVNEVYLCGKSRGFGIAHKPDWFCADGRKKEYE